MYNNACGLSAKTEQTPVITNGRLSFLKDRLMKATVRNGEAINEIGYKMNKINAYSEDPYPCQPISEPTSELDAIESLIMGIESNNDNLSYILRHIDTIV